MSSGFDNPISVVMTTAVCAECPTRRAPVISPRLFAFPNCPLGTKNIEVNSVVCKWRGRPGNRVSP